MEKKKSLEDKKGKKISEGKVQYFKDVRACQIQLILLI